MGARGTDKSKIEAMRYAGYTTKTPLSNANDLLRKDKVKAYIDALIVETAACTAIGKTHVWIKLEELRQDNKDNNRPKEQRLCLELQMKSLHMLVEVRPDANANDVILSCLDAVKVVGAQMMQAPKDAILIGDNFSG